MVCPISEHCTLVIVTLVLRDPEAGHRGMEITAASLGTLSATQPISCMGQSGLDVKGKEMRVSKSRFTRTLPEKDQLESFSSYTSEPEERIISKIMQL